MSTEMNLPQDPNAPFQPPPAPQNTSGASAAAATGTALEPTPTGEQPTGQPPEQLTGQDGTPKSGEHGRSLDGKKKELADKKSALDQLQKDVAKLKAEIQLMETGASENQAAAEQYKMARAKWEDKLSALPGAAQAQMEAVAAQLGSDEATLNEKMKGPQQELEQARTKAQATATGATQAEQAAHQAAQNTVAAEGAYAILKNAGSALDKHASAITAKAGRAEGMKQKDPAAAYVMLAQVKQDAAALKLMTDDEIKAKLQQRLGELNTCKQAAQTAQEAMAAAKQAAQTAQKEYETKVAQLDSALAAVVGS